jgi:hypothetical protein
MWGMTVCGWYLYQFIKAMPLPIGFGSTSTLINA